MTDESAHPTPSGERMPFDELVTHADVASAGNCFGLYLMEEVKGILGQLNEQERVVFYAALLRVPLGCIKRDVGVEAAIGLLDAGKEYLKDG